MKTGLGWMSRGQMSDDSSILIHTLFRCVKRIFESSILTYTTAAADS